MHYIVSINSSKNNIGGILFLRNFTEFRNLISAESKNTESAGPSSSAAEFNPQLFVYALCSLYVHNMYSQCSKCVDVKFISILPMERH